MIKGGFKAVHELYFNCFSVTQSNPRGRREGGGLLRQPSANLKSKIMKTFQFEFTEEQVHTLHNALLSASIEREDRYKETNDEAYYADKCSVDLLDEMILKRLHEDD